MKLDKQIYEKIIHSKEFKNWFGDWEHPNSKTSKIVDKDGKPLVVYHGSPYKFTEFKYNINQTSTQVNLKKNDIDINDTLEMLVVNTGEREIRVKRKDTQPIKYKIEKYDNKI